MVWTAIAAEEECKGDTMNLGHREIVGDTHSESELGILNDQVIQSPSWFNRLTRLTNLTSSADVSLLPCPTVRLRPAPLYDNLNPHIRAPSPGL